MVEDLPQKTRRLCVVSHAKAGLREMIAISLMASLRQPLIFVFGSWHNVLEKEKRGVWSAFASPLNYFLQCRIKRKAIVCTENIFFRNCTFSNVLDPWSHIKKKNPVHTDTLDVKWRTISGLRVALQEEHLKSCWRNSSSLKSATEE